MEESLNALLGAPIGVREIGREPPQEKGALRDILPNEPVRVQKKAIASSR